MSRRLIGLALPCLFLAGMLLALLTGSLVQTVQPGTAEQLPAPQPVNQQIGNNAKVKALCEQILAGKLHVASPRGEVHARRQCRRDGW